MTPLLIGTTSGLIIILLFVILKQFDKKVVYGLILSGIGFLYVGYTWMDLRAFIMNSVQAIFFLFIAYYGIKRSLYILAAGYILHGTWDLVYHLFAAVEVSDHLSVFVGLQSFHLWLPGQQILPALLLPGV